MRFAACPPVKLRHDPVDQPGIGPACRISLDLDARRSARSCQRPSMSASIGTFSVPAPEASGS